MNGFNTDNIDSIAMCCVKKLDRAFGMRGMMEKYN